ncbi:MAG TPA: hypothetical protein VEW26_10425 [Allosphingosinicella sp.]|nr:hypothetical protein [Allosphingosinicella sp.]
MEDYLKSLIKVLGIGAAFAAIPLFASLAGLQPPWPPAIGYVSAALVLLASLIVWELVRKARSGRRRLLMIVATLLTLAGLFAYLILYSSFIENIPGSSERVVRGYECNHDAKLVYGDRCPDLPRDALRDAEWESLALWTRSSVTTARVALTVAWLVFMSGLIAAVGSIVAGRKL